MATVRFLPRAERDLLGLSEGLQDQILEKVDLLRSFPSLGGAMERAYQGYRYLLAGPKNRYRIIYKVTHEGLVEIAYIRHCRRQIGLRLHS